MKNRMQKTLLGTLGIFFRDSPISVAVYAAFMYGMVTLVLSFSVYGDVPSIMRADLELRTLYYKILWGLTSLLPPILVAVFEQKLLPKFYRVTKKRSLCLYGIYVGYLLADVITRFLYASCSPHLSETTVFLPILHIFYELFFCVPGAVIMVIYISVKK